MCGICGYVNKKMLKNGILSEMNDTMRHREPNDSGAGNGGWMIILLVWHKDICSFDGVVVIVFSGKIYDYIIRKLGKNCRKKISVSIQL